MKKLKMMISLFITILSVFYLSSCIRKDIEPKVYMFNPEVDFSTINFDLKVVEPEEILIKEIYIKLYKENELETTLSSQDGINIVGTTEDIKFQMLVPQTQYKIEFSFDYLVGKYNDEDIVVYSYGFVTPENKPGVSGQILDDYFSAASVTFNVAYADENDLTKDFNIYLKQGDKLIDSLTIYKGNGLRVGCTFGPLPPNENYTILLCATFEYEGKQYEDLILDKIEYDTNNYTYVFYPTANFSNIRLNEDVITFNLSLQSRYCMITNLIVVLVDAKENIIAQLSLEDDLRIGKNENCKFDGLYPSKSYTIQVIADYQSKYEEYKDVVLAEYKFKTTAFAPTPTAEISNVFVKDDVVTFNSTLTDTYHLLIDYSLVLLDSNDVIIEKLSKSERLILGTHAWIFDLLKPNSEYKIAILGSYEYKGQYILDEELTVQTFKTGNYTLLPSAKIEDYYCKGAELNIGYTLSDPYNMITDYSLVLLDPNDVVLEKHSISDIELGGMCYDTFNLFLPDTSYKIQLLVNYKYRDKTEVYITQEIFKTDVQSYLPSVTITRINLVEDKIDFEYSVSDTYSLLSSLRCEIMGEDYAFSKMIDLKDKMSNGYHTITVRIGKNITNFDIQLIADYSYHIYEKNNEIMDSIEVFENSQEDFEYYIYDAGVTITKYIGESSTCVIPKVIEGNEVIAIGNYAFENCDIKFVVIPDSVTNIGYDAFKYCHNLIGITIPNSVTEIEWSAFWDCDNLRSIEIPSSVTRIGSNVFANCSSLTNVYYGGTMDEWLALKCEVIHSHHFYIKGKNNKWEEVTSIEIPETFTEIPKYLLYGFSGVTSITIPSSVTKIGDSAFGGCSNLTSIVIPDSVTSIGNYAFNGCRSLASIIIPKSVTSIGTSAFQGCSNLASIIIPKSVTSIGTSAFNSCRSLKDVYYEGTMEDWCKLNCSIFAFYADNLNHFYLLGENNEWEEVTTIEIPETITEIGYDQFDAFNSVESIIISNSVTTIGGFAFRGCSNLTSIVIPNSVTSIGTYAFSDCDNLMSITLPSSIESIGKQAFSGCSSLTDVYYEGTIEDWCNISFEDSFSNPMGYYAKHIYIRNDLNEWEEPTAIEIPETITKIGDYQFRGFDNLTSITISAGVTSIGSNAFYSCDNLTSVIIPNSVTSIGSRAFYGCFSLTSVVIPNSVESIEEYAFTNLHKLTIYCEASSQPAQWSVVWAGSNKEVLWGYNSEE